MTSKLGVDSQVCILCETKALCLSFHANDSDSLLRLHVGSVIYYYPIYLEFVVRVLSFPIWFWCSMVCMEGGEV